VPDWAEGKRWLLRVPYENGELELKSKPRTEICRAENHATNLDNIDNSFFPPSARRWPGRPRRFLCRLFQPAGLESIDQFIERCRAETATAVGCWSGCSGSAGRPARSPEHCQVAERDRQPDSLRLKKKLAEEFRDQLMVGVPTDEDEAGLRRLAEQLLQEGRRQAVSPAPLHAKLYLLFRPDPISPKVGYLGSSNLTFAGLSIRGTEYRRSRPGRLPETRAVV